MAQATFSGSYADKFQNATGVNDLGPIHYKPFKDNNGSILLLAVNCIKVNIKSTSGEGPGLRVSPFKSFQGVISDQI